MPIIDRDGVKNNDEALGSGPPLRLPHGYSLTSARLEGQNEALSKHHKFVLPDISDRGKAGPITSRTYQASVLIAVCVTWLGSASLTPAAAQQFEPAGGSQRLPFVATLSNNTPLVVGMDVEGVSRALGEPLRYFSGRPGNEIYLAIRNIGGSGLFNHNDRLYLLFRKGRLAGWKGDWGHNWMWQ
jgi:hypothetical protein